MNIVKKKLIELFLRTKSKNEMWYELKTGRYTDEDIARFTLTHMRVRDWFDVHKCAIAAQLSFAILHGTFDGDEGFEYDYLGKEDWCYGDKDVPVIGWD